jgi:hypothetical protein
MKYWLLIIYILSLTFQLFGQQIFEREKRDNNWLLGGSPVIDGAPFDVVKINFSNEEPLFEEMNIGINFHLSNSSISSSDEGLLLYTNGAEIRNSNNDTLAINLASTQLLQSWTNIGYPLSQGVLFLSLPNSDSIYYLFHTDAEVQETGDVFTENLYITVIDVEAEQEPIIHRDVSIINDTLTMGRVVADRHANGRDWWIVVPEANKNSYYSILFSPNGIEEINNFAIGDSINMGVSQSRFSPNGQNYARIDIIEIGEDSPHKISLYDFDRCTGEFTSFSTFSFPEVGSISGGMVFSENSRFLYAMAWLGVYQFDLWAEDVSASKIKVLEFDTLPPGGASGTFGLSQLAPNGKIYVSATGANEYLSVIHKPNLKGVACQAEVRAIELAVNNFESIPNHPYYGLGPLDGSSCDTLNIDNPAPQVAFDYVIADSMAFTVDFYDGSIFSPDQWYWEFGDGATSTEHFPSHTYMDYGSYQVCLTASNATGSNTVCQEVLFNINSTKEEGQKAVYKVWPNPSSNNINISSDRSFSDASEVRLYTVQGRRVMTHSLSGGLKSHRFNIGHLNSGIYWLEVNDRYGNLWREKVFVQ